MTQPGASQHDKLSFHRGLRTSIAAALAFTLTQLFHLPGGYWAAISAIVVMQSEVGATTIASRDRFAGTAIGAMIGWLTTLFWNHSILIFALAVLVAITLSTALRLENAGRLGGVTVAIIVLIPYSGPAWQIAIERFLEVSFGISVSLGVALTWQAISNRLRARTRRIDS